jgi:hypothetical protein
VWGAPMNMRWAPEVPRGLGLDWVTIGLEACSRLLRRCFPERGQVISVNDGKKVRGVLGGEVGEECYQRETQAIIGSSVTQHVCQ